MSGENENHSINSLSTLGALSSEVLNYDSVQFADLTPGYLLGEFQNYRLLKCLGEGGMGQTWLAEELSGGEAVRKVVVKILTKELCGHEEALAEVRRVFDLTSKLFHPNICATLGMKKDPIFGWILVMDYADGGTLSDWFRTQPNHENGLPLAQILPLLRPIAEALDFAHRKGILHRDVKPQNIMFAGKTPLLIDFGIAARIRPESVTHSTQTLGRSATSHASSTSGTPVYMAPEQMMGKPQTGRTDQYALALVLYELLVGKLPFEGDSIAAMSFQKASFNPENPNFPASVNSALRKALSTSPDQRFTTCLEFFNALSVPTEPPKNSSQSTYEELVQANLRRLMEEQVQRQAAEELARRKREEEEQLQREAQERADLEARARAEAERLLNQRRSSVRKAGERMVKTADGIEYVFRWCPAGTFMMGSPKGTPQTVEEGFWIFKEQKTIYVGGESDRMNDEVQHKVTLTRGFWMLETQVTQAMWKSVMGGNPSHFKGDQNPVECVSWDDCQDFCRKLSSELGVKVNLPTEAQWEYACRAGTTTAYSFGSSLNGREANCDGNYPCGTSTKGPYMAKTMPVRSYSPNAWGLYDMHGNVWEWCLDIYEADYYVESPTSDPLNSAGGSSRVLRGGSWYCIASICRSANRGGNTPGYRNYGLGFRMVWQDSGE